MFLFITVLGLGEKSLTILNLTITGQFIVKILLAVIVVVLNYVFSKFFVFRKQETGNRKQETGNREQGTGV